MIYNMEDRSEALYNSLFQSGDYTKSFEEFKAQFSTEEKVGLLYSSLSKSGKYTKTSQEFSEQFFPNLGLKKKDEPMESTSESGSLDSFGEAPEDSFLNTPVTPPREGEAVADAQAVNYGVPREGQSVYDFDEEVAVKNARKRDAEDTRDLFDRSLDVIDKRQHEQDMKVGLNFKDRDFTGRPITDLETDEVVSEMAYNFGEYGFKFEHAKGALGYETVGDIMTVTSPDGNHTENIELDNWTNATDSAEAKKLRKFMEKYKPINGLEKIQKEAIERDRKVLGKKDYDERMLDIQVDTRNLKDKLNAVVARKEESDILEKELMAMSDEEFAKNIGVYQAWEAEKDKISVDAEEVKTEWDGMAERGKELDRVVGDYTAMRAEAGNFFGYLVNEFWSSGFGRLFAVTNDTAINAISMSMPAGYKDIWAKYQKGMLKGAMKDNPFSHAAREFIPQDRKGTSQLIRERGTAVAQAMGSGTSQEYADNVGFVQGAIGGVAGSIAPMIFGLPALIGQGIDFVNQETENNPNFEGITELEKFAIAAPMGVVMGWLEHLGLTRALAGKSGITTIVLKFLQKYKITPGTKTFTEYVDTEIKKGGNRLLLRLTASTMSEFETGGLQEISDIAFKEVYDIMKEEKMFDTPETIGEAASQVWWGAVAEAIGGFVMGTPGAVNSALTKGKITELSDGEYEAFEKVMEDENLRGAYAEKLKQDVLSGKKSKQEALDEWNESEKVKGSMGKIPNYYTAEQKKKALELLIRKSELQDIVDKGEKQLVTKEQAEIDAIDAEMTAMSTETDTSTTTETDADGNVITNTVTVDEASAKIKLQEEGIKNPTQEQIDTKQAEMLEEGISQENLTAIDNLAKNIDSSGRLENRNKDLFGETQETSQGSAVLSDITESNENGVATGTYTNTETGDVDVVVSSKGKSDFVSFSRIYEDGKPTNSWSSKMINEAGSDFVTMLTEAQKLLPEGHQWTESKSISESGLGVWNKALKKGYEAQVDSEGNVITKSVTLNEAEKGKSTSDSSDFNDVIVETKSEADAKIKELEGIYPGIVAKPVRVRDGKGRIKGFSFKIELPVLVKGKTETKVEDTTTEEDKYQFGGRRKSEEDSNRKAFEDNKIEKVEKEDMDVTIDKAREGDVKAQEKLDKYGLKWAKETIYRFIGKSEVDALEKGETIEGKSKTAGVDVTSSSEVTSASDADYRVTFKEEGFDDKKKGSRVRMKNEKDGWVPGGYNKSDVAKIEKKNEDGTWETVYDSEAEVEVDVATQIKNLQTEAKAFIAAEKSKSSKGLPAYSKEFIQEDKKRREEIKRLKGLIAKKTPKKKAKVKSVQEEEAPKQRVVTPLQGESIQDAIRRTRGTKKAKGAKKSTPKEETTIVAAPYFNTTIKTLEEAETLRQGKGYKDYKKTLSSIAKALGIEVEVQETIGGYENDAGEKLVEISTRVVLKDATLEQAEEYAALMGALTPEVQEATIAAQYVKEGATTHNATEYSVLVSDKQAAMDALKVADIANYTLNEATGEVTFTDVFTFSDKALQGKIGIFIKELKSKKVSYENNGQRPIASQFIDAKGRREILRGIEGKRPELRQVGNVLRNAVQKAIGRDAKFQGITAKEYKKQITQDEQTEAPPESGPVAGNRLFNEPISAIAEIADRYYQRAFGTKRPNFKGTKKLDKVKAKKISDAFEAMKHSPNNPKVREAYNAMAKETIAQYKAFLDAGYVVEINNEDPYANSQEMIDDLRNNKRIKILSTESGFGEAPITPKQRKENPLLATTTFTDVNGKPLLVNDLFRAIHDFFGHAELGNSFGPIGEENAWNVHARMYSPLARRAMTTETRGQNSYVNFSGINDKIDKIRKKAIKLREEGKYEEALKLTNDIYENTFFADQKVGILPEEFYQIPEEEKKVVRTAKPLTKKEEEAEESDFIKIAGKPGSKKRAAWVKKQNKQNTKFRLNSKAESEVNEDEVSEVTKAIDSIESPNVDLELSFESATPISLENLNNRTDSPLKSVTLKVVDGVPTIFTITDQLTTGNTTNPETGNPIDNLKGSIGFNGTEGNESFAWASTTEEEGKRIVNKALKVFNDNPELYYAWWEANPEYYGLVPMNVVKMGEAAILSNEAVFRVLLDNIKSLPIKNRKAALKLLKQEIKTNLATLKGKKVTPNIKKRIRDYSKLKDVIGKSKAILLDDVLSEESVKQLSLPQRTLLVNRIAYGEVNNPGKKSKNPGAPKKAISIALMEGQPIEGRRKISLGVITDAITDPELRDVPIGNVVALVGVDVLNPGVGKTTHSNYEFGVKGKSMGILTNPVPMQEAYPIAYINAFKKLMEQEEKGEEAFASSVLSLETGIGIGIPSYDYAGAVSDANSSDVNNLISFLNLSFPHVTISANSKEFNKILETEGVKSYLKGGEVVYGVTTEGDVYINPDVHNSDSELFNTAIHEMSHVWTDYLETTPKGRALLAKGIELVKKTEIYQEQLEEFDGDTEAAAREALSILIGNKGQTIVDGATRSKFKEWLLGMWNYIKKTFNISKKTKVEDLTLDEFIELALSDILGGKEIKTTPEQREAMRSLSRFSKKGSKSDLTKLKNIVVKAIKDIRAQGKSESAIKTLLENRGLEASLITELMAKEKGTTKTSVSPTEETNEGYNKLTSAIDAIIAKGYENGTPPSQIAVEAISFLQDSKVYKSEKTEDIEREQMLRDLRKRFSMKETSSPSIKKILGEVTSEKISITEANLLKAQIKALNRGAVDMKSISAKASKVLAKEVKELVKKGSITTNQSARILARFAKTDVTNDTQVNGFVDYITNIYNKSEDAYRNSLIAKIQKLIKKNTKVTRTAANRIKGKGLDAESQQFFAAMNRVLDGILKTKSEEINEKDFTKKFFPDIEVILQKDPNSLTTKENSQLFAYMSFNSLKGIRNMTLEEVEQLLEDVKLGTKGGRSDLQAKRMAEKAEMDELRVEADASINEGYKGLLNPDGTYINRNRINDKSELTKRIKARNRSVLEDIKVWKENYIFTDLSRWIESLGSNLKNLKTLTNSLDKEGNFFVKNVHSGLRKMETETIKGIESEKINKLDEIASSIKGVKNYNAILKLLSKGINSKVEGLTDSEGNPVENDMFPLDILLRWYALSKNEVQRKKLLKQGFTEEKLSEIKVELGPELVEFADKIIEYLSSPYFETINKVYKRVNNVNLVQIENYFPTQSVLDAVSSSLIQEGDWNAVLSKMNEGATKLRTNTKGDVLLTATDFTTALESHLEEMERYKAYAEGSLKLEKIFKFPSVNSLLNTLGVMQSVKNAINFAINPDGGKAAIRANVIDKLMTQYTGFALATKIMQIGKQATSAIWAFEKYNFRGKGKTRIPGVDLAMYMVDTAEVIATFPFQLAKAYKMSAVLRDRFRKAFKGDVRGLESGSRVAKEQRRTRASIWKKLLRFGLGSTTTIGDIMGVMGYMATYNRDIRNGMDPEVALAKFEEFNETQQSRMNIDKIPLQMMSNYAVRGFTMFGSTLFLAINKVMQGTTNIQRGMRKFLKTGKAKDLPSQEDFRAVFIALGVANVFFTAMANAFKYISGDDDDQEEVIQRLKDAMIGLNLIYQIPYLGSTVEEAVNKSRGIYRPGDSVVNPLTSIFRKWARLQKKAEQSGKDSDYKAAENALRIAFEMYSGTQLDFFEGIYGLFDGDFSEEDMYKVLGVSSSYQPENAGSSDSKSSKNSPTMTDKRENELRQKNWKQNEKREKGFSNDGFDEGFGNDGFDDEGF